MDPRQTQPEVAAARLVHELQVHQVELELQNEELRETQGKLEVALRRATDLYDFAPVGYFTVLRDGTIREANLLAAEILRVARSALLGQRLHAFIKSGERPHLDVMLADAFGTATKQTVELTLAHDAPRPVRVRLAATVGMDGRDCFLVMEDVTALRHAESERVAIESQMVQAQKLESLGVMAGGVAHDFNNLLSAILGHANLALGCRPDDPEVVECLKEIGIASHHAAGLCRQLLAYAGRGRFLVEPVDLSALLAEQARLLRVSIAKQVELRSELAAVLPRIEADPGQLNQVVMNLLINASEAIGDLAGVVTLSTGVAQCDEAYLRRAVTMEPLPPAGDYVYLEIADTGCGMDAATRARVFEPFFSTKFTGRGLGLAAVLGIVRRHKGALVVDSEPGRGTKFRVLFPAAPARAKLMPPPVPHVSERSGTILVVDDDVTVRKVMVRTLVSWGYRALLAEDGEKALEVFRANRDGIDAVVLDLAMPRMGGEATFRELRRLRPGLPVILTSGNSEPAVVEEMLRNGLAGFLEKPLQPEALRELLQRVLAADRASRR